MSYLYPEKSGMSKLLNLHHVKMRKFLKITAIVLVVLVVAIVGCGFYMLNYSLSPEPDREKVQVCFEKQYEEYPETKVWVDSLRAIGAFRDTFVVMDEGDRHHAYYVNNGSRRTALVLHGWRDCPADFLYLARLYNHELGYNVVMPDAHASGLSDGESIRMGWLDRKDVMSWMKTFQTDTMVVHGVSMGAAAVMMLSGEKMPEGVRDLRFVEDCGYTSVWDEFKGELKNQFGLPPFPLLYTTSMLCKLRYGWSFKEASAVSEVSKCHYPMLFIHGNKDTFVPTEMVYRVYEAKPDPKELWITEGTEHALSYKEHREEYIRRVKAFCLSDTTSATVQ